MPDRDIELLKRLYQQFNARDLPAILKVLHPDVMWANGMDGGHVHGHAGVRGYWTRQWTMIDPRVEPAGFTTLPDGAIQVEVLQTVRDLNGNILSDKTVRHVFHIDGGLVGRFDIG